MSRSTVSTVSLLANIEGEGEFFLIKEADKICAQCLCNRLQ